MQKQELTEQNFISFKSTNGIKFVNSNYRDSSDLPQSGISLASNDIASPPCQQTGVDAGGCNTLRGDPIETKPILDTLGHSLMHSHTEQIIHHPITPPHQHPHSMHPQIPDAVGASHHNLIMSSMQDQQQGLARRRPSFSHSGHYSMAGHSGLGAHHHHPIMYPEHSTQLTQHITTSPVSLHNAMMQHRIQNTPVEMES